MADNKIPDELAAGFLLRAIHANRMAAIKADNGDGFRLVFAEEANGMFHARAAIHLSDASTERLRDMLVQLYPYQAATNG